MVSHIKSVLATQREKAVWTEGRPPFLTRYCLLRAYSSVFQAAESFFLFYVTGLSHADLKYIYVQKYITLNLMVIKVKM